MDDTFEELSLEEEIKTEKWEVGDIYSYQMQIDIDDWEEPEETEDTWQQAILETGDAWHGPAGTNHGISIEATSIFKEGDKYSISIIPKNMKELSQEQVEDKLKELGISNNEWI